MTRETTRVADLIRTMELIAPPHLAMAGDPIGLQVGRPDKVARKVLLALDPSPQVIERAVATNVDLLITHHALMYRPLHKIDTSTARGGALADALTHDLAIYAAHTNLDVAEGGVNDVLAALLNLDDVDVLDVTSSDDWLKVVVFVPESHVEAVSQAMGDAGGGRLGNYSHCTFRSQGEGTFFPLPGADPFVGAVGAFERVAEFRVETIVPQSRLHEVVSAMKRAHPYEEVAYDVHPLRMQGKAYGLGRIGNLPQPKPLEDFAVAVKNALGMKGIRFSGSKDMRVQRIAVIGGSGGKWAGKAIAKGADVLVTADSDHHVVAEAWQDGLAIVDATHAAMERPILGIIKQRIEEHHATGLTIDIADVPEDPFHWTES